MLIGFTDMQGDPPFPGYCTRHTGTVYPMFRGGFLSAPGLEIRQGRLGLSAAESGTDRRPLAGQQHFPGHGRKGRRPAGRGRRFPCRAANRPSMSPGIMDSRWVCSPILGMSTKNAEVSSISVSSRFCAHCSTFFFFGKGLSFFQNRVIMQFEKPKTFEVL